MTTYFTEERVSHMSFLEGSSLNKTILDGFELNDDQVTNWRTYRSQFYSTYHYPIVKEFIKTYIK